MNAPAACTNRRTRTSQQMTTASNRRRRRRTTALAAAAGVATTTKTAQMIILSTAIVAVLCGWFSTSKTSVDGFAMFRSYARTRALSPASTAASSATASTTTATTTTTTSSRTLSMTDTRSSSDTEFELQVGRALDTLRRDYPKILSSAPDYSIYHPKLSVIDPSGVQVNGLQAYKNSFRLLHALVKFIYCPSRSTITFRMCFDKARQNIRIHWNAVMLPREIFGGSRTTLHVDGISVYEISRSTGEITQHRIEHLLFNSEKVQPAEGVIAALQREHAVTVPTFCHHNNDDNNIGRSPNTVVQFQPHTGPLTSWLAANTGSSSSNSRQGKPPSLFAMEATSPDGNNDNNNNSNNNKSSSSSSNTAAAATASNTAAAAAMVDMDALERKNKSRQKFGLKPLSVEEFLAVEADIQRMQLEKQQEQQQAAAAAAAAKNSKKRNHNLLDTILNAGKDAVQADTCESNFDCERPQVCCDFGFRKVCCHSGSLVGLWNTQQPLQPRLVPVPVDVRDPTNY